MELSATIAVTWNSFNIMDIANSQAIEPEALPVVPKPFLGPDPETLPFFHMSFLDSHGSKLFVSHIFATCIPQCTFLHFSIQITIGDL
jgi:hypothetical protein